MNLGNFQSIPGSDVNLFGIKKNMNQNNIALDNFNTDIFFYHLAKSTLSQDKLVFLLKEWYFDAYSVEPVYFNENIFWRQVIWSQCKDFLEKFGTKKDIFRITDSLISGFNDPVSHDLNSEYFKALSISFFSWLQLYITDEKTWYSDSYTLEERQKCSIWIGKTFLGRDVLIQQLNSDFKNNPYSFYGNNSTKSNPASPSVGYVIRWLEIYLGSLSDQSEFLMDNNRVGRIKIRDKIMNYRSRWVKNKNLMAVEFYNIPECYKTMAYKQIVYLDYLEAGD